MNRRDILRGMLGGLGIALTSPLLVRILGSPDAWAADSAISGLTAATALTETDIVPIVQGGVTKKSGINLFDDFVNLDRRSGVDPTGVADSAAAIQAVLDTGVRSVYAPSIYKVNTGLQLQNGQILHGIPHAMQNQGATPPRFKFTPGVANRVFIKNAAATTANGVQDISIELNDNSHTGIQFSASYANVARRIHFLGTMRLGLVADDTYVCNFEDVVFAGSLVRTACIAIGLSNAIRVTRLHTSGFPETVGECMYGIMMTDGEDNLIDQPVIQGATIGIATSDSKSFSIREPYFENTLCNMRLGNLGSFAGKCHVTGGKYSAPTGTHTQFAKRGPMIILACNTATFDTPDFESTAANAAATGPWPFVSDACNNFTLINPFHFGGAGATYTRDLIYRRIAGSNTGITIVGSDYDHGSTHATELIVKESTSFGSSCRGIRVDNAGVITAVAYQPAIIFADFDPLLQTNLPVISTLLL